MDKTEVSIDEVKYVAQLAKLNFTDKELVKMQEDLKDILDQFRNLDKVDLSGVGDEIENAATKFRKDETKVFEDKEKLMQNVKSLRDGAIEVPKIIE